AVYLIAFICLLHIDEMLNIQAHKIDVYNNVVDNTVCASITLSFHKNTPFDSKCIELLQCYCLLTSLTTWIDTSDINEGNLFPNINKCDCPITIKNTTMVSYEFHMLYASSSYSFRTCITPYHYSTHSFFHGGCQWFSCNLC
ncbi:uncharacterized protein EV420DRAFT_1273969, partial [Desarmillaria tabescens]